MGNSIFDGFQLDFVISPALRNLENPDFEEKSPSTRRVEHGVASVLRGPWVRSSENQKDPSRVEKTLHFASKTKNQLEILSLIKDITCYFTFAR